MRCSIEGCDNPARYRTVGEHDLVALLCLKHTELSLDEGWPPEQLISLPKVAS